MADRTATAIVAFVLGVEGCAHTASKTMSQPARTAQQNCGNESKSVYGFLISDQIYDGRILTNFTQ